jgi:hypothetical protein
VVGPNSNLIVENAQTSMCGYKAHLEISSAVRVFWGVPEIAVSFYELRCRVVELRPFMDCDYSAST